MFESFGQRLGSGRGAMLAALLKKELLATLRERSSRMILVAPIILYVILFGYIATFNVEHVPYALLDLDRSQASAEWIRRIDASPVFERAATLSNTAQIAPAIEKGEALVVVAVENGFAARLAQGGEARVQAVIDGRNSSTAQLAAGYLSVIAETFNAQWASGKGAVEVRYLFNPNTLTRWFIMPGLIVMLSMLQVMVLAGLSVAREREQGTFEQILVTPSRTWELVLSKDWAPVVIGLFQSTLIMAIDVWWFDITLKGSLLQIYAVLFVFTLCVVGMGLAISARSRTMQQGLLTVFFFLVPMVLLSGLFTPIENMPAVLQYLTYLDPLRFALQAVRRIYLANAGWMETVRMVWPIAVLAAVSLPVAFHQFKKRL